MSIVERAADLLESAPQAQRKPAAAREATDTLEPDLIERAVSDDSQRSGIATDKNATGVEDPKLRPAFAAGRDSRTVNIDLDRLRQQNMVTPDSQRTPIAECFRRIKRHILANVANPKAEPGANLVMITSALPGEGKTFCSVNLAISIAMEMDRTVLLVDADVAKPSLPQTLGLAAEKGLMDVLLDRRIDVADVLCKTNIGNLTLLPAGTQHKHATELLASKTMNALLLEMAERYRDRIIIFDSPPLLAASEAGVLANQMGQILVVAEAGETTETALKVAVSRVESSRIMGVLLNKATPSGAGVYDGYGYGYGYGYGKGHGA